MTDKLYLITEAQRKTVATKIIRNTAGIETLDMLQSLPMVDSEPVAYLAHYYIEPTIHTEADDGFDVVEPTTENAFPVYTSPQALTDDGSDWFYQLQFICRVLEGVDPAKQDKATALGMARSLKQTRWTAEKALTPITVDDVPDSLCFSTGEDKEKITEIYNAVIKNRSEAQ